MSWAEDNGIDIGDWDDFDQDALGDDEWLTRNDEVIKISDMTNQHLYNAYRLTGNDRLQREVLLRLFKKAFEDVK